MQGFLKLNTVFVGPDGDFNERSCYLKASSVEVIESHDYPQIYATDYESTSEYESYMNIYYSKGGYTQIQTMGGLIIIVNDTVDIVSAKIHDILTIHTFSIGLN